MKLTSARLYVEKVGDRGALIDQLWLAIEALPDPDPQPDAKRPSKRWDG